MGDDRAGGEAGASSVSAEAFQRRLEAGDEVRLLDVRDRDEIEEWRVEGPAVTHTHIPYAKFMAAQARGEIEGLAAGIEGDGTVIVVCGRGEASEYVAGLLAESGIDAENLAGGMEAWARVYECRPIEGSTPAVFQYRRPASGCLSYLVVSGGEAAVVDPLRAFADRYVADAEDRDVDIVAVLDTHVHADHVSGLTALADATGARALVPAAARDRGITHDVETLADGEGLTVGEATIEAIALPGHTTEMTGYRVGTVLLGGDSVFVEGIARPDLQEGVDVRAQARELYATLTDRLAGLDCLLAPGHHDTDTERSPDGTYTAPLARALERATPGSRAAFVERVAGEGPAGPRNADRIVAINLGLESVDDGTAFELELGPNNCAL